MEITAKTIKSLKKNTNSVIDQLADLYETENKVANEIVSLQEQIKELQAAIDEDKATLVSLAKEKESLTSELVAQLDEVKNTFVSNSPSEVEVEETENESEPTENELI